MEEALLPKNKEEFEEERRFPSRQVFVEEFRRVNQIAMPMIVVTVSQYLLRVAPMLMLGHLSKLNLSSAGIGSSLSNVTGFSIIFGMSSALETLCGQAYGAKQYQRVGIYTYCAIICLFLVCLPISLLWIFMDKLLIFIGQDPLIAKGAGEYSTLLIPTLFAYSILQSLVRYLQTQSLIMPMLLSTVSALFFHLFLCWAFVFKLEMGNSGAAIAVGLGYWLNTIMLVVYVMYSSACEKTRVPFSKDVFLSMGDFFCFAIPSALMVCLEWWSFELVILLSGLLPNPELEASVLSICFTITSLHYHIPYSFGAAGSTRVSNELGAGNSQAARVAVWVVLVLTVIEFLIASATIFCFRHILGYAFSSEGEVVGYIKAMTPLICLQIVMDSSQAVLSGVVRGSGWQHMGAYVNLAAYYLAGVPVAVVMGFVLHLRGKGLWSGLTSGATVQSLLLAIIICSTNWKKQVAVMEETLLEVEEEKRVKKWDDDMYVEELKKVSYIAAPMVVVTVSQYLLRVSAMTMVGHLGELQLSSSAIATSLTNVTGFSLVFGMANALETLCGQAYGAEQYHKLGTYTCCGILCLTLVCIPLSLLYLFVDKLLMFLGQDPLISAEAGKYSTWLILALFPYTILQPLTKYLQAQSLIMPMVLASVLALCFHIPICWGFVFKLKLGISGAALAIGLSHWFNVILLGIYMKYSSACEKTRICFLWNDVFLCVGEFFQLAIPSAMMICLEWWSLELVILLAGLLPNPKLEASVLSIGLTVNTVHFFIPCSLGIAASTQVSNKLGGGKSEDAKVVVWVVLFLGISEAIIASLILFCSRFVVGYGFSNSDQVVDYVKNLTPLICVSIVTDSLQTVLGGVARGSGWQHLGAYVNLAAYYLAGIPVALLLGFVMNLKGIGLWIGILTGSTLQASLLSLITCFTDWQKQAVKARERIFERSNFQITVNKRPESS